MISISLCNQSTTFKDADLPALANALQIQVKRDFYPVWGIDAKIYYTPTGKHPTADHWILGLFDDSTVPGALGFHETTPTGQPIGNIFVKTTIANGGLVSVTASHELLEMLLDPEINLTAEFDDGSGAPSKFYSYECGDPVESDSDGYDIQVPANFTGGPATVRVSDFVLPAWFEGSNTVGPFDFRKLLKAPFTLNPGGYAGILDLANLSAGWQQVMAKKGVSDKAIAAARPQPGSRRERRRLPRSQWMRSTYDTGSDSAFAADAVILSPVE